jgi:hypothetical protein
MEERAAHRSVDRAQKGLWLVFPAVHPALFATFGVPSQDGMISGRLGFSIHLGVIELGDNQRAVSFGAQRLANGTPSHVPKSSSLAGCEIPQQRI